MEHKNKTQSYTSRPFETENDLKQMRDMLFVSRSLTDDWHYAHVGELMWGYFMVACHLTPKEHIYLWYDGEKLIGYAILGEDPSVDFQVSPEYEWVGIETEVMDWVENRLADLRKSNPQRWNGSLRSGARQDNGRRRVFLGQHGFRYSGEFAEVNMLRSLDKPIPDVVLPIGCQVRAVDGMGELAARAAAHRGVWQPWSDGDVSDEDYISFMKLPSYNRDLDIVTIAADGKIAATVNGWLDPINRIGNFGQVGALPNYRRRGLTRSAILEGLRRMRTRGMDRACVSTGVSNYPARRLYESIGFEIMNEYLDYEKT